MSTDRDALAELFRVSTPGTVHTVQHYAYLPTKKEAEAVAVELRRLGFRTEQRLGADETNWLVLASHDVIPSEELMVATRQRMEALVARSGGEYDGWEAAVRR